VSLGGGEDGESGEFGLKRLGFGDSLIVGVAVDYDDFKSLV
jgi:hypothetical protein